MFVRFLCCDRWLLDKIILHTEIKITVYFRLLMNFLVFLLPAHFHYSLSLHGCPILKNSYSRHEVFWLQMFVNSVGGGRSWFLAFTELAVRRNILNLLHVWRAAGLHFSLWLRLLQTNSTRSCSHIVECVCDLPERLELSQTSVWVLHYELFGHKLQSFEKSIIKLVQIVKVVIE